MVKCHILSMPNITVTTALDLLFQRHTNVWGYFKGSYTHTTDDLKFTLNLAAVFI